jgi:hypothetical protein
MRGREILIMAGIKDKEISNVTWYRLMRHHVVRDSEEGREYGEEIGSGATMKG